MAVGEVPMRDILFGKHGMAGTIRALLTAFLAVTLATCSGGGGGSAGTPSSFPPTISLTHFAGGLARPVAITHAGDGSGRLFVAEQGGLIRTLSSGVVAPAPFLDISSLVTPAGGEQGLLGLAFPPG